MSLEVYPGTEMWIAKMHWMIVDWVEEGEIRENGDVDIY